MILQSTKILTAFLLTVSLTQSAFGASNGKNISNSVEYTLPHDFKVGDIVVDLNFYSSPDCDTPQVKSFIGVAALLDIGLALVGRFLEDRKDGLRATYSGSKTQSFKSPIQCIKVERKKLTSVKSVNPKTFDYDALMTLEMRVEDYQNSNISSQLVLQKLDINEPAPSKSKRRAKTRINYAVSVGFTTVDSTGKERAFSRNLPLVENVPLTGEFKKAEQISSVKFPNDNDKRFASTIFAKLPSVMDATITVSITETDAKFAKAEEISDFFDDNMSIIDTVLGDVLD